MTDENDSRAAFDAHGRKLLGQDPGFANFFNQTLASIDPEDLVGISPQTYESILRHSYTRLGQREPEGHLINIWSPDGAIAEKRQVIDIFIEDMPFLVDSVVASVRALGHNIVLISHPVFAVDTSGAHWQVLAGREEGAARESFLQIHIEPTHDEQTISSLHADLDHVLTDVRRTVHGWRPMLERLRALVQDYRVKSVAISQDTMAEALHFLAWLADHNFTFLGMREYRLTGTGKNARLDPIEGSGLGILEDPEFRFLRHGPDYVEMTAQHVAFLQRPEPLMITKANVRAYVHRRTHMDYIGAKIYDDNGALVGELRIVGLFTSMALATPHTEIPVIRRKISGVMHRSGFDPRSHAGKALMAALDNYPRDELFQISDEQLFECATVIAALPDRPRIRVLPRVDPFDNFVSVLTYLPRDRYTSELRARIGDYLAQRFDGRVSAFYPHFPEGGDLVRVHYIIGRVAGETPHPSRDELEADIEEMSRNFGDRLMEAADDPGAIADYRDAFPAEYQSHASGQEALIDIAALKTLTPGGGPAVRLLPSHHQSDHLILKVYHRDEPISLSSRVPLLEHFGFSAIDEQTYILTPRDGAVYYLHEMIIAPPQGYEVDLEAGGALLEDALLAVWRGNAENDSFNQLALTAGLTWDKVAILRAYGRFIRQMGTGLSQRYLAATLASHPEAAHALVDLFFARLDPAFTADRDKTCKALRETIDAVLAETSSIDEDRIIRRYRNLIEQSLRTNFFQTGDDGDPRPALAIKLNSGAIDGLPEPRPYREIFVYSPRVEGVHLRFGAIARGGIRWSDRPEDFRTEVLGLVKAQNVKNAIIVPVGAKGGFVPKLMPPAPDRETFMAEGTACYKIFIGALLDITDNLDGDTIVEPKNVLRPDGDDPYLVVAADKGTASFSDIANQISDARDYWLSDAFASGGSAGYDHKRMAITARGAWEAVKRHFREVDHDIQKTPFSVVGVGDMSGDVFGNGMLLSPQIRLIAAFDHRDIFIDPDPDCAISLAERKRLFGLGRSSWQDYDIAKLSPGGGVFSRSLKSISLSSEARAALGIDTGSITPEELIRAILCAQIDLLWFGGIGTYIAATGETNAEVGDRANAGVRVTAEKVRARVIGEGANLGVTQRGRIEFAAKGGRINTDAIDNSAGVNSSDLEVNIKIALGALVRAGKMTLDERNAFLVEMTSEVAALCLRNNYLQTLALSLSQRRGMAEFPDHVSLLQTLEHQGHLNRAVEFLPDDLGLIERGSANQPLTRPELAVLLAYAKNVFYAQLLASNVPDDPYLSTELYRYFPDKLKEAYSETIENHRLRREVIATVLSNAIINRGGPTFVHAMTTSTSASADQVAFAYAAARDSYGTTALNAAIDALDAKMNGKVQLALYAEVQTLLFTQTLWFLRNVNFADGLSGVIDRYAAGVEQVRALLGKIVPQFIAKSIADQAVEFIEGGASRDLARRIAELSALSLASDIVLVAEQTENPVPETTAAYFAVLSKFRLSRITEQSDSIVLADRYDRMALDRALANLMRAQRELTADVLTSGKGDFDARYAAWHDARAAEIDKIIAAVTELTEGDLTVSRLSVAAGLLSDLVRR